MRRSPRLELTLAVMILGESLFGSHDPHPLGMVGGEGQLLGVPDLDRIGLAVLLLDIGRIGRPAGEHLDSGLVQFPLILF